MGKILQFKPRESSNLSDLDLAFKTIKAQKVIDYRKMLLGTNEERARENLVYKERLKDLCNQDPSDK